MNDTYSPPPPGLRPGARVWLYVRDSGGPSQEQSTEQQEQELVTYCKRYALCIVRVFRDVARSGGSTVKRDEFMQMVDMSEAKPTRPDALLIWNFARFARDYDDFQFYKSLLKRRGVIVHSLTDPIPVDDFAGHVMEVIISLANEEKRRQTSRDVKRGLRDLTSRGKGYAPGTPPKGYKSVPVCVGERRNGAPRYVSKWEPDPVLSEFVKLAWQLRAEGKSYKEITKATNGRLYTSSPSWHDFFLNKTYLGIFGKGEREIPDHFEPLITWELWEAVQRVNRSNPLKGGNGLQHPRRVGFPTLLSGFTYCLDCGAMMTHTPGNAKRTWRHYVCGKKYRQGYASCNSRRVGADKAEAAILGSLGRILTPEYMDTALDAARQGLESVADIQRELTAEKRRLEDLDLAIARLLRTIEKTDSPSALVLLTMRERELDEARANVDRLSLQLANSEMEITPAARVIILDAWRKQFDNLQEAGNVREIKPYLMQFIRRIELGYNQARIFYTYPMTQALNVSEPRYISDHFGGTL